MNTYVVHGWDKRWLNRVAEYPAEPASKWATPGVYVELGLPEHLIQASAHNLKVIPNFLTDTRA